MNLRSALRHGLLQLCSAFTLFAAGCAPSGGADLSLDETTAREALVTFLDTWKAGGTSASLQEKSPQIFGRDFEWDGGATLVSYELAEDLSNDGANLDTMVNLTIRAEDGVESVVQARYTVGTEPEITVIRSDDDVLTSD